MMNMKVVALGAILSVAGGVALPAQTTIAVDGDLAVEGWGKPVWQTIGQTFTAPPVDESFDTFSFWLEGNADVSYKAYVFAWSSPTQRAVGAALFESEILLSPAGDGFLRVDLLTGGVPVIGGDEYVVLLSMSGLPGNSGVRFHANRNSPYLDGKLMLQNNGENTAAWTTEGWANPSFDGASYDMRFEATFSSVSTVPEPSTYAMMGAGLLGLALVAHRRRAAGGAARSDAAGSYNHGVAP